MARIFADAGAQVLASASGRLYDLNNFSVAFWMFRTATPVAERNLVGGIVTVGWHFGITTGNLIRAYYSFATADKVRDSTTAPALNTWVHVIVTHKNTGLNNTDFLFYFNGKQEAGAAVTTGSGVHTNAAVPLTIGNDTNTGFLAAPVQIGQTAIWNRDLSPAEAMALGTGAHPTKYLSGLIDLFEMQTGLVEVGQINNTLLIPGATNPTSAAVNPPIEPIPTILLPNRQNYRTRRARYIAIAAGGIIGAAGLGQLTITGFAPAGNISTVSPAASALAITGQAPAGQISTVAGFGQLTITGQAARSAIATVPGLGSIVISGFAPAGSVGVTGLPGTGQLVISGQAAIGRISTVAGLGQTVISGFAARNAISTQPGFGQISINGFAAAGSVGLTAFPGTGSVIVSGFAPTGRITSVAGLGQVVITGYAAGQPITGIIGQPGVGAIVITGYAATGYFVFTDLDSSPISGAELLSSPMTTTDLTSSGIATTELASSPIVTTDLSSFPSTFSEG